MQVGECEFVERAHEEKAKVIVKEISALRRNLKLSTGTIRNKPCRQQPVQRCSSV